MPFPSSDSRHANPTLAGGSDDEVADVNRRRQEHLRFGGFQRGLHMSVSNPSGYDVIGDIHGCADELEALLDKLGYRRTGSSGPYRHTDRQAVFVGDVLHIRPAKTDGRAADFTETQFRTICRQLVSHVGAMAELYAAEVAA